VEQTVIAQRASHRRLLVRSLKGSRFKCCSAILKGVHYEFRASSQVLFGRRLFAETSATEVSRNSEANVKPVDLKLEICWFAKLKEESVSVEAAPIEDHLAGTAWIAWY
jgi:hypothetical protein